MKQNVSLSECREGNTPTLTYPPLFSVAATFIIHWFHFFHYRLSGWRASNYSWPWKFTLPSVCPWKNWWFSVEILLRNSNSDFLCEWSGGKEQHWILLMPNFQPENTRTNPEWGNIFYFIVGPFRWFSEKEEIPSEINIWTKGKTKGTSREFKWFAGPPW